MNSMRMRRLALVIGINEYPAPQTPLHGCVGDARRIGHFLLSARGGSFAKVIPLMDRHATIGNIRQMLRRASNEHWDQVVVYFAGHGSQEGILAWDKLLRFQELAPAITSIPARHHLLILDACYSGAVHEYFGFDGIAGLEKYATADAARIYMELLRRASPGLRVITAVDRNTTSLEVNEEGLFTTALLRAAMTARPDLGPWGVSAGQVLTYASRILDEDEHGAPMPLSSGELDDFPLAVTDSLHRLGSIDAESTWVRWAQPEGRPAEFHFGFRMDISGRKLMPVWVQHELRDDLNRVHLLAPARVIPRKSHEVRALFARVPAHRVPRGRTVHSCIAVWDEHHRILEGHVKTYSGGLRVPVRVVLPVTTPRFP